MVKCRFHVTEKNEFMQMEPGHTAVVSKIKMTGVSSEPFGTGTPVADCQMVIVPKNSADEFEVGKYYLVQFDLDPVQQSK